MMHGHEKSDPAIVAVKPTNKAERSAAEPVEPRAGTKGNAGQQSTRQTQSWARVSHALDRIRQFEPCVRFAVTHPRWEPHAGKPHVRICAGGARQLASLPLRRRDFIFMLCIATVARPFTALAQQPGKIYRVGVITATAPVSEWDLSINAPIGAFVQTLRHLGYVEGQNLVLERRSAEGRFERFADIIAELVNLKADVIVTSSNAAARTAKTVTTTVPIVAVALGDPVGDGLVQSLARPGGNITGATIRAGHDIEAKRLEFLKEMLPGLSRVAYLGSLPPIQDARKALRSTRPKHHWQGRL